MGRKNINFKALARSMGVPTSTNTERINFNARGDEIEPDHYRRLLKQKEVFHHPKLPILVVRTNYNKVIKLVDKIRCVHLKIYNKYLLHLIRSFEVLHYIQNLLHQYQS